MMVDMSKIPQVLASLAATMGGFSLGIVLAWTSPVLPFISDCNDESSKYNPNLNNCTLPKAFTKEEGSWISSLFGIGALFSCAISGILMSKIGRKWTLITLNGPLLLGWICLLIPAYKTDITTPNLFYVGRILTGLGTGGFATVGPVYISEVTETSIRGSIGTFFQLMMVTGIAVINGLGIKNAVHWGTITILCTIPAILTILAIVFMPESPFYLVGKNREEDALKSLIWLRGSTSNVYSELEDLKKSYKKQRESPSFSYAKLFTDGIYFKPFIVVLALMFNQQFSGINAVYMNLKPIFLKAGSQIDAGLSAFIISLVRVAVTLVAAICVDKFGRKPLLLLSGLGTCLSLFALGVFFFLDENKNYVSDADIQPPLIFNQVINETLVDEKYGPDSNIDPQILQNINWLPMASLAVYTITLSLGLGPLPFLIMAEIFPQEAKDKASSLVTVCQWSMAFVTTKFITNINDAFNVSGGYFFFGSMLLIGTVFIIAYAPETKGKTNEEMKEMFLHQRRINHKIINLK